MVELRRPEWLYPTLLTIEEYRSRSPEELAGTQVRLYEDTPEGRRYLGGDMAIAALELEGRRAS
jgi:hypothetical protein